MIMHEQIKDLFTSPLETMSGGLWYSGVRGEGEYKEWYEEGKLCRHSFYKNSKVYGKHITWHENGQMCIECFYKNSKYFGEYKEWFSNGKLASHIIYNNGNVVKRIV